MFNLSHRLHPFYESEFNGGGSSSYITTNDLLTKVKSQAEYVSSTSQVESTIDILWAKLNTTIEHSTLTKQEKETIKLLCNALTLSYRTLAKSQRQDEAVDKWFKDHYGR